MKVWVTVVVVTVVVSHVDAQFRFPNLPSPPEIFFGAFRPLFTRPRSRPRLRPRPQFLPQQSQRPPVPFPPRQVFRPQAAPLQNNDIFVSSPVARPVASLRPPPEIVQRRPLAQQQLPPVNLDGFGSPHPNSLLNPSEPQLQQPRPQPQRPQPTRSQPQRPQPQRPQPQRPQPQRPQPQRPQLQLQLLRPQTFSPSQSFPGPLPDPSDNNIIGMTPPPPPKPEIITPKPSPPSPTPPLPSLVSQVLGLATPRPIRPLTAPSSNSVEELLVNPVPAVNAGVLPLANEKPTEPQLFPPLSNLA